MKGQPRRSECRKARTEEDGEASLLAIFSQWFAAPTEAIDIAIFFAIVILLIPLFWVDKAIAGFAVALITLASALIFRLLSRRSRRIAGVVTVCVLLCIVFVLIGGPNQIPLNATIDKLESGTDNGNWEAEGEINGVTDGSEFWLFLIDRKGKYQLQPPNVVWFDDEDQHGNDSDRHKAKWIHENIRPNSNAIRLVIVRVNLEGDLLLQEWAESAEKSGPNPRNRSEVTRIPGYKELAICPFKVALPRPVPDPTLKVRWIDYESRTIECTLENISRNNSRPVAIWFQIGHWAFWKIDIQQPSDPITIRNVENGIKEIFVAYYPQDMREREMRSIRSGSNVDRNRLQEIISASIPASPF